MKDLLILTMFSGENEFPLCKASLEQQSFRGFEHVIIENLSSKAGHEAIYKTIMENAGNYRRFLKLDADMVLRGPDALKEIQAEFDAQRNADCVVWHVLDYYSNQNILGIHMFSNRVSWDLNLPDLYVDPDPTFPGCRVIMPKETRQHVLHSPSPSPRQAFEFGVHRAQKCFNQLAGPDYARRRQAQFGTLYGVWRTFLASSDYVRGMAIVGAEHFRRGNIRAGEYKNNQEYDALFARALAMKTPEMKKFCQWYWGLEGRCRHLCLSTRLKFRAAINACSRVRAHSVPSRPHAGRIMTPQATQRTPLARMMAQDDR